MGIQAAGVRVAALTQMQTQLISFQMSAPQNLGPLGDIKTIRALYPRNVVALWVGIYPRAVLSYEAPRCPWETLCSFSKGYDVPGIPCCLYRGDTMPHGYLNSCHTRGDAMFQVYIASFRGDTMTLGIPRYISRWDTMFPGYLVHTHQMS